MKIIFKSVLRDDIFKGEVIYLLQHVITQLDYEYREEVVEMERIPKDILVTDTCVSRK